MNSGPSNPKSPKVHIYLPGESLAELALKYGVSLQDLLEVNLLTQQSIVFPGHKLTIPEIPPAETAGILPEEHIVSLGESLASIANKYGLTVDDLRAINQLSETAMLYPGTYLSLKAKAIEPEFASNRAPKHCLVHGYHKVKTGDQINRIAAFHGISTQSLLMANNLSWNSVVAPGSKLVIPISHNALTCPSLVQLSETSLSIAKNLIESAQDYKLDDFACVVALCLEMQRSGLQPELGNRNLRQDLLIQLSKVKILDQTVFQTLLESGFAELAEGAALWEPSAWAWLHQIRSNSE